MRRRKPLSRVTFLCIVSELYLPLTSGVNVIAGDIWVVGHFRRSFFISQEMPKAMPAAIAQNITVPAIAKAAS